MHLIGQTQHMNQCNNYFNTTKIRTLDISDTMSRVDCLTVTQIFELLGKRLIYIFLFFNNMHICMEEKTKSNVHVLWDWHEVLMWKRENSNNKVLQIAISAILAIWTEVSQLITRSYKSRICLLLSYLRKNWRNCKLLPFKSGVLSTLVLFNLLTTSFKRFSTLTVLTCQNKHGQIDFNRLIVHKRERERGKGAGKLKHIIETKIKSKSKI